MNNVDAYKKLLRLKNYRSKKKRIIHVFSLLYVFIASYSVQFLLHVGDVSTYSNVYEIVAGHNYFDALDKYRFSINTKEYIHFICIWLFSFTKLPYWVYLFLINAVFIAVLIELFFLRNNKPALMCLWFVPINFYILVLMLPAERLKLSIIFYLISLLIYAKKSDVGKALPFIVLSALTHAQNTLLTGLSFLHYLFTGQVQKKNSSSKILFIVAIGCIGMVVVMIGADWLSHLDIKMRRLENNKYSYFDLAPLSLMLFVALYYCKNKIFIGLAFLSIGAAVLVFGGARLNIIAYGFIVYLLVVNRSSTPIGFIIIQLYFNLKGLHFIYEIYHGGDGFGG